MGIKDLNKFITTFTPAAIKKVEISKYKGTTLAVDVSIFLYKYKYSHKLLHSFLQQFYHFKKEGIELIYVFDGKPPAEKAYILNNRKVTKEKQNNKIEDMIKEKESLTDEDEIKKLESKIKEAKRRCITITSKDIEDVKKLFDILGAKYIHPNCEADLICCNMFKEGKVSGCISNDMDFLPSGTGILIRNYNLSDKVDEYNLDTILKDSLLTYDKFVDLCILCGCDYTTKIHRLGFVTAYRNLLKYNNIEEIIENLCIKEKKFKVPENFDYETARKLLKNSNNDCLKYKIIETKKNKINEEDRKFIMNNTKYTELQLNNRLNIIFDNSK